MNQCGGETLAFWRSVPSTLQQLLTEAARSRAEQEDGEGERTDRTEVREWTVCEQLEVANLAKHK